MASGLKQIFEERYAKYVHNDGGFLQQRALTADMPAALQASRATCLH